MQPTLIASCVRWLTVYYNERKYLRAPYPPCARPDFGVGLLKARHDFVYHSTMRLKKRAFFQAGVAIVLSK